MYCTVQYRGDHQWAVNRLPRSGMVASSHVIGPYRRAYPDLIDLSSLALANTPSAMMITECTIGFSYPYRV